MPTWFDFLVILAVLGGSGGILGRLGRVLAPLGGLLGRLWPVLCATWRVLARLGRALGASGHVLGASWRVLARKTTPNINLGVVLGSPKKGAQLCFAERVDAIKMIAKTRSEHGVARPILCRKKTWNLLFFHWFFKLFSFQDDCKNSPNINPPAVVARSRLATHPPPDLPLSKDIYPAEPT